MMKQAGSKRLVRRKLLKLCTGLGIPIAIGIITQENVAGKYIKLQMLL